MAQLAKRVLLLVHPRFRPDRAKVRSGTEWDIWQALKKLGFAVDVASASHDLRSFEADLVKFRPEIVFNLLEEFRGEAVYDFHLVSYLEALGIPCTGCNPRGLILSRNKFLVGQIAGSLGIPVPRSELLFPERRTPPPRTGSFPLFVKLNREHASLGIREANRVRDREELRLVCDRLRKAYASEILIQDFIPGQDVSLSVWGDRKLEVFSPRLLHMGGAQRISTERLKFNLAQQQRRSLKTSEFKGPMVKRLKQEVKQLFKLLDLSGYARFDYRIRAGGQPFLIDVNANPNLARDEDFAVSAELEGWDYEQLVEQIVFLGLRYQPSV